MNFLSKSSVESSRRGIRGLVGFRQQFARKGRAKTRSLDRALAVLRGWGMVALAGLTPRLPAAEQVGHWAEFVEPDFPFFSSVLDARDAGPGWPENNLTPRGVVLNLGHGAWACFDIDLLRMAAIWSGPGVTPVSMSQGSYREPGRKAPPGQEDLPEIDGRAWLANGIYPGWQVGEDISLVDPRQPGPDPKEMGRGPLPASFGRFRAVRLEGEGVVLEYEVDGHAITERVTARWIGERVVVQRAFVLESVRRPLRLILGMRPGRIEKGLQVTVSVRSSGSHPELTREPDSLWTVRVPPSPGQVRVGVSMSLDGAADSWDEHAAIETRVRWPETLTTRGLLSSEAGVAYVVDNIELPTLNPWRRNTRLADLAFFKDGRAAAVTYDGDVWMIDGLRDKLDQVRWRRFASGFHEPLGICLRAEEVYVFDRNGIWRVRDTDANGEADRHELFSNAFTQTAETREFATGIRVASDGSFIIAKGGQQSATLGKHNGTVLRVAPDGESVDVLGWGLRMPFIGVDPETGLVTASDQQGNYVPTTPLHVIGNNQYYGFLSPLAPKERYPASIAAPLTWIPHAVNASGVSQVWLRGARLGPLNDALIHLGYYRPELFLVRLNERGTRPQAAVISLTRALAFPPLNAVVNPRDGQLYVIGFQIWGSDAAQVSGLARVRYTGAENTLPREVVPTEKGVLLRFDVELEMGEAVNRANYSAERWNYRRTPNYGSPHYRLDGSKGQEPMAPSSVYLSRDRRSVFIGLPDMKPVMQMRLSWTLRSAAGVSFADSAYFTPAELAAFEPVGFDSIEVDLTPRSAASPAATPITAEEGQRVAHLMGCVACHSTDGSTVGKVGPSWKGVFGSLRMMEDGNEVLADEDYLRESIKAPTARIVHGFNASDVGMPSYEGVISEAQIEALVLYLTTLK